MVEGFDCPKRGRYGTGGVNGTVKAGSRVDSDTLVVAPPMMAMSVGNGQLNQTRPEPVGKTLDTMDDVQRVVTW